MPDWVGSAGNWPAHDSLGPHGCRVALFGFACHVFGFAESDWLCGLGRKIFVPLLELRLLNALRWRLASLDQHLVMEELSLTTGLVDKRNPTVLTLARNLHECAEGLPKKTPIALWA